MLLCRSLSVPRSTNRVSLLVSAAQEHWRSFAIEEDLPAAQTRARVCSFHSTSYTLQAIRRRRRRADILERPSTPAAVTSHQEDKESDTQTRQDHLRNIDRETASLTAEEFRVQALHLISRIHTAMTALQRQNSDMILSQGRTEMQNKEDSNLDEDTFQKEQSVGDYLYIDLGPLHGQYTIQADETSKIIIFLSPISGQRLYRYDAAAHGAKSEDPSRWVCTEDGHVLEGLLVRDLIRQIQGVPNL